MFHPIDPRILELLSVFDDSPQLGSHRHNPASACEGRRYTHTTRTGRLDITVWTQPGTAWVSLEGLLSRRAAHALATLLKDLDTPHIVLNTAAVLVPSAHGGTPLINLCATLSYAGHSVAVVGDDRSADRALPGAGNDPSARSDHLVLQPIA